MVKLGRTAGAAATYIVLATLQRGLSLLVLPFVTRAISPAEYGAASTLAAASVFLTAIIATPLIQLIVRAAARGEENGPAVLRAAGLYCYVLLPVVVSVVAVLVIAWAPDILGVQGKLWGLELLAVAFQPAASVFGLWVSQAREDLRRFVLISSVSVIATVVSKLLFVVVFQMGVLGWVLSDLFSAVVSAVLAFAVVRIPQVRLETHHIRYLLRFTLPLVPHSASLWALMYVSRPAMAAVSSLEQVGILSLGLNLAQLAGMVLVETNRAVLPRFSRETFPAPTHETRDPVRWQLMASLGVPAVVGFGTVIAGPWIFPSDYWPAFAITGILLIGQAAFGLYFIPMNYLTQTAGHSRYSALASGAGAAVILVLILLLGRRFGAAGVAYATSAGYLTMAAVALLLTRVDKLAIAWRAWRRNLPEIWLALGALACSAIALADGVRSTLGWLLSAVGILVTVGALVVTTRRDPPTAGPPSAG